MADVKPVEYDIQRLKDLAQLILEKEGIITATKFRIEQSERELSEMKISMEKRIIEVREAKEELDEIVQGARMLRKINSSESLDDNK
jgi:hypothetical protein